MEESAKYVHLRVHSAYSLAEGALPIKRLVDLVKRYNMPALGISDTNNLFGALEFSETLSANGVQPIIGCTISENYQMEESAKYVHLRVHSAYSLAEGALPIKRLVDLVKRYNMPALGISDTNNLFGALEFSETLSANGVQPIIGCTISVRFSDYEANTHKTAMSGGHADADGYLALIAKDKSGYINLMQLISAAYLETEETALPHVTIDNIARKSGGLIVLTGGPDGPINQQIKLGNFGRACKWLDELHRTFDDRLYVELQRHGTSEEQASEPVLLDMAYKRCLPIVASNQPFFPDRSDYEAHDALLCIAEGSYISVDERRKLTKEHYFKSSMEMAEIFADLPEAVENTIEIARRCSFRPQTHDPILPQFVTSDDVHNSTTTPEDILAAEAAELAKQAKNGLKARLLESGVADEYCEQHYWDRLEFELDVINSMKFPGYFLIVADFIKWTKGQGIPVGPGRGSGAGSLVAWSLTITDLDPICFGLLFERFLNPARVSMPDFDIDFCQNRRDEVIRYVQKKYGADRVAQIITFGKLQARAVLRDVGRVLQMPYGQVDRLCKLVPNNPAKPTTLKEAIDSEPKFKEERESEEVVDQLLTIALKLEGLYRHASTHAAGVVIADRPITELVPLYLDPRADLPATQFNMKWVEPAGLVKFDFLGLKTLTVIQKAVQLIEDRGGKVDFQDIGIKDQATYELLSRGDTIGVFQLESSGMRESLKNLRPDRFEDIIAMVSLYRPGPMDSIPTYIDRKYGREEPDYLHETLQPILEETYGVIIYQEQVMQIAQTLAGYSLGEADLLRRAMGKKIKAEMDQQRSRFVKGATEKGVDRHRAEFIFELVNKFAGYGFNKSHAAAYALLAFQTAYLKANYPVEFMAAIMTLDQGNTDKVNIFTQEVRALKIELLPPCVNASSHEFLPEGDAIRYSLAALKNVGFQAIETICAERADAGDFKSLADFAMRLDPRSVNKRALEMMVYAGAFDILNEHRAQTHANIDRILAVANKSCSDRSSGQDDLFGDSSSAPVLDLRDVPAWQAMEKLSREHEAIGFYFSGHPLDEFDSALKRLKVDDWFGFVEKVRKGQNVGTLAGTVSYCQERRSKKGNKFAFAGFSDRSAQFEAVIFSDTLAVAGEHLEVGKPVLLRVEAELDGDSVKTRVQSIKALDDAISPTRQNMQIILDSPEALPKLAFDEAAGPLGVMHIVVKLDDVGKEVIFDLNRKINISTRQISMLRTLSGVRDIAEFEAG